MDAQLQRTAVLEAAEKLFYGKGIQAVGMDEIRTVAGVSLKAIYKLFPSKDVLVAEVLAIRDRRWTEGLHKYVDRAPDPASSALPRPPSHGRLSTTSPATRTKSTHWSPMPDCRAALPCRSAYSLKVHSLPQPSSAPTVWPMVRGRPRRC
jgi:AcrR family transcriptional regulator